MPQKQMFPEILKKLEQLRRWSETALGFLYPEVCQYCLKEPAVAATGFIGSACAADVRFIQHPFCERCGLPFQGDISGSFTCANCGEMELHFESGRAAVAADGMVLDLIHRWKYNRALWVEPFLGELLSRAAREPLVSGGWDLIVPVPLHPLKEREREFNQAQHLARRLSRATGLPLEIRALRRVEPTRTQTRLTRSQRTDNMRSAFAADRGAVKVLGRNVVLIDDVLTTGATASACARVLRAAGAGRVCVWTLARGLLH